MSQQTKVRFGPVVTSSMGAFYPLLPHKPPDNDSRKKRRRERHPAGNSSNQNGATFATPEIPPFRTSPVCDRSNKPSPISSCAASPVSSCRVSPIPEISEKPSTSPERSSPVCSVPEKPSPIMERASPVRETPEPSPSLGRPSPRESNEPSPAGSIPTIPEEEEPTGPSRSGSVSSNRKRRHSSGQRVVRRTRTRHHRPGFASRKVDVLGQMQIMCAVLIIILEVLLVTNFPLPDHFPGIGFVAGLCFLVSGGLGILSSCTRKHAQILLCMMTAVIAMVVAAFVGVFAILGFLDSLSYGDDDEEVLNQLFYMLQAIICSLEVLGALGQAAICCCATCCLDCKCRRKATEIVTIYQTCPTTGSGSLEDVKKAEESAKELKEKEMTVIDKMKEKESDDTNKDEGIENDGSTSGCELDDDDVLLSNEELDEFWVIPRVVRGGSSAHRSRSDSTSSKKRERRPSGNSNKNRNFSDSSDKRERNFSGNSAKSEKRRHSSSSKYDSKKERHDSGFPDTPVAENFVPNFERTTILDPMVLVNYGSDDTIVRSERSSEMSVRGSQRTVSDANSVAGSKNSKYSVLVSATTVAQPGENRNECEQQARSDSQDDSVFVDMEFLPQSSAAANTSFTNSCTCLADSQSDKLGKSRDDLQDPGILQNSLRRARAEENLVCDTETDTSTRNCPGPSRQDSNMSNTSDCPSGHSLQSTSRSFQTSEEDTSSASRSSGFKSLSRESSVENT